VLGQRPDRIKVNRFMERGQGRRGVVVRYQ
jgi:hypothetical protein